MSMVNDPIADMMVRIQNAARARKEEVRIPLSKMKVEIGRLLRDEGYIDDVVMQKDTASLILKLRYRNQRATIRGMKRDSKPGGRKYVGCDEIQPVANGFGTLILSTSKGIMTGEQAKKNRVGGEPLLKIW